jgi:hypothetical protein
MGQKSEDLWSDLSGDSERSKGGFVDCWQHEDTSPTVMHSRWPQSVRLSDNLNQCSQFRWIKRSETLAWSKLSFVR